MLDLHSLNQKASKKTRKVKVNY